MFREDLERLIALEIVVRYYYQRGAVMMNLNKDKCLAKVVELLGDSKRYSSILSSPE